MTATNHDGHKVYHDGHSNENVKTNNVLLTNRQIHGEFTVIPSSENRFVAIMVCGRNCRTLSRDSHRLTTGDTALSYTVTLVYQKGHLSKITTILQKSPRWACPSSQIGYVKTVDRFVDLERVPNCYKHCSCCHRIFNSLRLCQCANDSN